MWNNHHFISFLNKNHKASFKVFKSVKIHSRKVSYGCKRCRMQSCRVIQSDITTFLKKDIEKVAIFELL